MSNYHVCPRCGHDPHGLTSSWMWIYRCKDCGASFCHECPGSSGGHKCPKCGSTSKTKEAECHTRKS